MGEEQKPKDWTITLSAGGVLQLRVDYGADHKANHPFRLQSTTATGADILASCPRMATGSQRMRDAGPASFLP